MQSQPGCPRQHRATRPWAPPFSWRISSGIATGRAGPPPARATSRQDVRLLPRGAAHLARSPRQRCASSPPAARFPRAGGLCGHDGGAQCGTGCARQERQERRIGAGWLAGGRVSRAFGPSLALWVSASRLHLCLPHAFHPQPYLFSSLCSSGFHYSVWLPARLTVSSLFITILL